MTHGRFSEGSSILYRVVQNCTGLYRIVQSFNLYRILRNGRLSDHRNTRLHSAFRIFLLVGLGGLTRCRTTCCRDNLHFSGNFPNHSSSEEKNSVQLCTTLYNSVQFCTTLYRPVGHFHGGVGNSRRQCRIVPNNSYDTCVVCNL